MMLREVEEEEEEEEEEGKRWGERWRGLLVGPAFEAHDYELLEIIPVQTEVEGHRNYYLRFFKRRCLFSPTHNNIVRTEKPQDAIKIICRVCRRNEDAELHAAKWIGPRLTLVAVRYVKSRECFSTSLDSTPFVPPLDPTSRGLRESSVLTGLTHFPFLLTS